VPARSGRFELVTSQGDDAFDELLRGVAASPAVALSPPREGDVLAGRLVLGRMAGAGGMGTVYRALDRLTGETVAVKIAAPHTAAEQARFTQEARLLAELRHPAIVRYLTHGVTEDDQPFLAMEWLEGEDLVERLARSRLSVADSVLLTLRAAEALAVAHARGIVHRDVKPSNLYLVDREPARVKLLDFGIARVQRPGLAPATRPLTHSGAVIGTVGYMSPEQATAATDLDARSDVFSLGCVLFECLTGQPAFSGEHVVAVLAKVLHEPAIRARTLLPELPEALDDLVARMLTKERTARPADAAALVRELAQLTNLSASLPAAPKAEPRLSRGEQRLVSVLLVGVEPGDSVAAATADSVERHGGKAAWLAQRFLLVIWEAPTRDPALSASRCALALQRQVPAARIVVATGRSQSTLDGRPGAVIDRATGLLAAGSAAGVLIDEVTAGLLGAGFDIAGDGPVRSLLGVRADSDAGRRLLGKELPCFGRDKELALLEATLRECVEDSAARAVLLTAPAGQGKSRLARELVVRARTLDTRVRIWTARGDPLGAGSVFVLARQLLRQALSLHEGSALAEQRERLSAELGRLAQGEALTRITDFLGELLGIPPLSLSPALLAARNDARIMAAQLRRAFTEWLAAECAAGPVLLVLEDLHWGDAPTVAYLGDALAACQTAPLMILALARPEVHAQFPSLFAGANLQELRLGPLTKRAAVNLVRAALSDHVTEATVESIVERGAGNPFYIEELIRRAAEGGSDAMPETVLALAQSRIDALEADARHLLRAGSIFGELFWEKGVAALAGVTSVGEVRPWLDELVVGEVLVRSHRDKFPGEAAYAFRHSLLREAAYASLTAADRTAGHGLAAQWLEEMGESDALLLANHHERGGNPERATAFLAQAALGALDAGDLSNAAVLAQRGIALGAAGETRGTLRLVQMIRTGFSADFTQGSAQETMREAMALLPRGSVRWFQAASVAMYAAATTGEAGIAFQVIQEMIALDAAPSATGPYAEAMYRIIQGLRAFDQHELARGFLERLESTAAVEQAQDPVFAVYLRLSRVSELLTKEDLQGAFRNAEEALEFTEAAGDAIGGALTTYVLAHLQNELGVFEAAASTARRAIERAERAGATLVEVWSRIELTAALANSGRAAEALRVAQPLLETFDRLSAQLLSAHARLRLDDLEGAQRDARAVLDGARAAPTVPWIPIWAEALLARIALMRGQPAEALQQLHAGLQALETDAKLSSPYLGSLLRLLQAEATCAVDAAAGRVLIDQARARVERIAASLDAPDLRAAFLSIDENARTLALASRGSAEP